MTLLRLLCIFRVISLACVTWFSVRCFDFPKLYSSKCSFSLCRLVIGCTIITNTWMNKNNWVNKVLGSLYTLLIWTFLSSLIHYYLTCNYLFQPLVMTSFFFYVESNLFFWAYLFSSFSVSSWNIWWDLHPLRSFVISYFARHGMEFFMLNAMVFLTVLYEQY